MCHQASLNNHLSEYAEMEDWNSEEEEELMSEAMDYWDGNGC